MTEQKEFEKYLHVKYKNCTLFDQTLKKIDKEEKQKILTDLRKRSKIKKHV
jgi:hypothetical protein